MEQLRTVNALQTPTAKEANLFIRCLASESSSRKYVAVELRMAFQALSLACSDRRSLRSAPIGYGIEREDKTRGMLHDMLMTDS